MTIKKDADKEALIDKFLAEGWKKNGFHFYKFMDREKKYLVSMTLDRKKTKTSEGAIVADFRFHNVELNEFSNFIHQYNKVEPPDIGIFQGFKIPISLQLSGWDSLPLVATKTQVILDAREQNNAASICNSTAKEIFEKYKDINFLADIYDTEEKRLMDKDCLIINLFLKRYGHVRHIFHTYFAPDGRGANFIIKYMDRYGL